MPQLEKLVPYILLPTFVVIGLRKPCTKIEVGTDLEIVMFIEKTCNVVVINGISIPGKRYQDQKYSNENILIIAELMKQ
jgi:hypothetical protein